MKTNVYPTVTIDPLPLFRHGALEFGPKVFFQKDDDYVSGLFRELFKTYRQLLKHCEEVSLYWWLGDGTDILVYDRNLDRKVAWACWQGFANKIKASDGSEPRPAVCYTDQPIEITYRDIRRIIALAKSACAEVLGKKLLFILPFDPGSEFNEAPFRYERHTEILLPNGRSWIHCIDAIGRFHADSTPTAGYPDGIPEGTPFGEFLGRQVQAYFTDMGADGIWFSNSFGFGRSPYATGGTGQFFDGTTFSSEGNVAVRDSVLEFWTLFRRECPDLPVLCRGTDFPVGVNLVNHASAYKEIYEGNRFGIVPPPNTPWSALTHNHGLALVGFLTQNAPFPGERLPLRFYTTDQWFCNNPWFDRWDRSPHDIYLSASMCKLSPQGRICAIDDVHVMGVDGSWGEIVSEVADEVIPHLKRAASFRPDALPPVLWVYPFDEHCDMVFGKNPQLDIPFGGDLSMIGAINHALPLAGAVTTANLAATREAQGEAFRETILVTPAPVPGSATERQLLDHLAAGGRVLCYGTLRYASPAWLAALGMAAGATPLEGEFTVTGAPEGASTRLLHNAVIGQGGLTETAAGATVLATAIQGEETRVLAAANGRAAWVRGGSNVTHDGILSRSMIPSDEREWFPPERLFTVALAALGWDIRIENGLFPVPVEFLVSRCRGGFVFSGHSTDDDANLLVRAPWGAPVPLARSVRLADGAARIPVHTWFHDEVRVFVRQREGVLGCHSQTVIAKALHRRWLVSGLDHADLRFYVEPGCKTVYYTTPSPEFGHSREAKPVENLTTDGTGTFFELKDVSGLVSIGWG